MKDARGRVHRSLGTRVFRILGLLAAAGLAMQLLYSGVALAGSLDGLLKKGVMKYGRGDYEKALEHMIRAGIVGPENPVPAYYAGLIMLRKGRYDDAVRWWRSYIDLDGGSETGALIRRHLTLLARMLAKKAAVEVVSGGPGNLSGAIAPLTTVVVGFESVFRPEWGPLRKGFTRVLIDDLSKVTDIRVLDGELVGGIMRARGLIGKSLFTPGAAARVGRELGAMTVTAGILSEPEPAVLGVKLVTFETTRDYVLGECEVRVPVKRFWELETTLAFEVLDNLGYPKESLPAGVVRAIEQIRTRSFKAMLHYSRGLDLLDKSLYPEARKAFGDAVTSDPDFELARDALAVAPAAGLSLGQIITSAEEAAVSLKTRFSICETPFTMDDGY